MSRYEYKVIPAPRDARRAKGVKGVPARFANTLTEAMNAEASEGWEFVRSETLPMDAPKGVLGKKVETFQAVLVFRRALDVAALEPVAAEEPAAELSAVAAPVAAVAAAAPIAAALDAPQDPPLEELKESDRPADPLVAMAAEDDLVEGSRKTSD